MAYMTRPSISPVIQACLNIVSNAGIDVGDGVAPDCAKPYCVVGVVSSPRYDGPLDSPEADSADRVQFSFIGDTREQADSIRDDVRAALTVFNLDAQFAILSADRRTLRLILDIPRGVQRDDRGLPNPIFTGIDQYMIETTPTGTSSVVYTITDGAGITDTVTTV